MCVASIVLASGMAMGCAVEDDEPGPTTNELAEHIAEVECAEHFNGFCADLPWADEASCRTERADQIIELYAEGTVYDAQCAASLLDRGDLYPLFECETPCQIIHGTKGEGETCERSQECDGTLGCQGGSCRPLTDLILREGEDCREPSFEGALCSTGLLCDSTGTGTCVAAPAEGEPCFAHDGEPILCGRGYFCHSEERTCQLKHDDGEPCAPAVSGTSCQSNTCEQDMCVPSFDECKPQSTPIIGCA